MVVERAEQWVGVMVAWTVETRDKWKVDWMVDTLVASKVGNSASERAVKMVDKTVVLTAESLVDWMDASTASCLVGERADQWVGATVAWMAVTKAVWKAVW